MVHLMNRLSERHEARVLGRRSLAWLGESGAEKRGYVGVLERGGSGKPAPPSPGARKFRPVTCKVACRAGWEESVALGCEGGKSSPGAQGEAHSSAAGLSGHAAARSRSGQRLRGSWQQSWKECPLQRPCLGTGTGLLLLPVPGQRRESGGREAGHSACRGGSGTTCHGVICVLNSSHTLNL